MTDISSARIHPCPSCLRSPITQSYMNFTPGMDDIKETKEAPDRQTFFLVGTHAPSNNRIENNGNRW